MTHLAIKNPDADKSAKVETRPQNYSAGAFVTAFANIVTSNLNAVSNAVGKMELEGQALQQQTSQMNTLQKEIDQTSKSSGGAKQPKKDAGSVNTSSQDGLLALQNKSMVCTNKSQILGQEMAQLSTTGVTLPMNVNTANANIATNLMQMNAKAEQTQFIR